MRGGGVRYYDELILEMRQSIHYKLVPTRNVGEPDTNLKAYRQFVAELEDSNTKRLLFDSRQALLFQDLAVPPEPDMQALIHVPFDHFYLELTNPIAFAENEPGFQETLRAFLFRNNVTKVRVPFDEGKKELECGTLTMFFTSRDPDDRPYYVDRTFQIHLPTGLVFTRVNTCRQEPDASEIPEDFEPDWWLMAGGPIIEAERTPTGILRFPPLEEPLDPGRYLGWWERSLLAGSSLFSWMMAYTMAKSIHVVQEPVSRQVRRWHERKHKPLRPWHLVQVEPKFYAEHRYGPEEEGSHHSYRYDVIGHLRFGRHHTLHRSGFGECPGGVCSSACPKGCTEHCLREQIEWVGAHQRGLANTLYIPKTYSISGDKRVSPRMRRYFGAAGGEKVEAK